MVSRLKCTSTSSPFFTFPFIHTFFLFFFHSFFLCLPVSSSAFHVSLEKHHKLSKTETFTFPFANSGHSSIHQKQTVMTLPVPRLQCWLQLSRSQFSCAEAGVTSAVHVRLKKLTIILYQRLSIEQLVITSALVWKNKTAYKTRRGLLMRGSCGARIPQI